MILLEKDLNNLSSDKHNYSIAQTFKKNSYMEAFKESMALFDRLDRLDRFVQDRFVSPIDSKISILTKEEKIFLLDKCKDYNDIIFDGIISYSSIRIIISDDIDTMYDFIYYQYNNKEEPMLSIFIGKSFYDSDDEFEIFRFMYDLSDKITNMKLQFKAGMAINNFKGESLILLNSNPIDDAVFLFNYFSTLFCNIIKCTNANIIRSFDSIYDHGRPSTMPISKEIMRRIWDYSSDIVRNRSSNETIETEITTDIYKEIR